MSFPKPTTGWGFQDPPKKTPKNELQVGHQGVFVTEATKDAPVVDVFHALEVKARQHLLGSGGVHD